jgi:hypothetical protein
MLPGAFAHGRFDLRRARVTLTPFSRLPWNVPFYAKHGFAAARSLEQLPHSAIALRDERARRLENRIAMVKNAAWSDA